MRFESDLSGSEFTPGASGLEGQEDSMSEGERILIAGSWSCVVKVLFLTIGLRLSRMQI